MTLSYHVAYHGKVRTVDADDPLQSVEMVTSKWGTVDSIRYVHAYAYLPGDSRHAGDGADHSERKFVRCLRDGCRPCLGTYYAMPYCHGMKIIGSAEMAKNININTVESLVGRAPGNAFEKVDIGTAGGRRHYRVRMWVGNGGDLHLYEHKWTDILASSHRSALKSAMEFLTRMYPDKRRLVRAYDGDGTWVGQDCQRLETA